MTPEVKSRLRGPFLTFVALEAMLGLNVALGAFFVSGRTWILEVFVSAAMVAVLILFSMEALKDSALTRLFAAIGFCWAAILFALTMVDYATR